MLKKIWKFVEVSKFHLPTLKTVKKLSRPLAIVTAGFLPGIFFGGQNLLLCELLLFSDQILGEGAIVSEGERGKLLQGSRPPSPPVNQSQNE